MPTYNQSNTQIVDRAYGGFPDGINLGDTVRQSADVTATSNTTLANLTGLTLNVAAGTYKYRAVIQCLATGNGGTKVAFKQNDGATLTSIQNVSLAFTTSAVAQSRVTTTTDQASLVAATVAHTELVLEGTVVVATAGSLYLQGAQNASHSDTTTFYTGSTLQMTRIG